MFTKNLSRDELQTAIDQLNNKEYSNLLYERRSELSSLDRTEIDRIMMLEDLVKELKFKLMKDWLEKFDEEYIRDI